MDRYAGRTALVVGGTSGIGLATARRLSDEGARVMVTGRTPSSLETVRHDLGPTVEAVRSDASVAGDVDELARRVTTSFGALDLVFVNAGVTRFATVADTTPDDWDELFAVNARGPYFLVQKLAPLVVDGGSIVLTTSVADAKGLAGSSVYAATKAAVRSMVRSLGRELLPRGIRVNAVSPGPIDTGILERALPAPAAAGARAQMIENNPMGRFGRADEVAAAVAFLGAEATFTTGAELTVDGGVSQL